HPGEHQAKGPNDGARRRRRRRDACDGAHSEEEERSRRGGRVLQPSARNAHVTTPFVASTGASHPRRNMAEPAIPNLSGLRGRALLTFPDRPCIEHAVICARRHRKGGRWPTAPCRPPASLVLDW